MDEEKFVDAEACIQRQREELESRARWRHDVGALRVRAVTSQYRIKE